MNINSMRPNQFSIALLRIVQLTAIFYALTQFAGLALDALVQTSDIVTRPGLSVNVRLYFLTGMFLCSASLLLARSGVLPRSVLYVICVYSFLYAACYSLYQHTHMPVAVFRIIFGVSNIVIACLASRMIHTNRLAGEA